MITVSIKPEKCYVNGKQIIATQFNVVSISDNLFNHVTFKYTLLDENGVWCGEAVTELKGEEEYTKWDASPAGAYQIVADKVGLEVLQTKSGSMF